jgi:hypothetical protein
VLTPHRRRGLSVLLDSWEPLAEDFPEIDDLPPSVEEIF